MSGSLELAPGSLFAGRYRIRRRLAAGGMGAVFEVEHVETRRRRALKIMLPELVSNPEMRERFQMEARVTCSIESEHLVDVFDAGIASDSGILFLVMEFLSGEELGDLMARGGPLDPTLVVQYLKQVASALDKTHAAGIIHRDLKPENLFLTHREDGSPRIKILDFGIAKVLSSATASNATCSLGTPLYMSPEQIVGEGVSPATDLYSLGLIAYSLLVGAPYWAAEAAKFENAIAFVLHTRKGTTESASLRASKAGRSLPTGFDAWFRRATHLDPTRRFATAGELVAELTALVTSGSAPLAITSTLPALEPHVPRAAEAEAAAPVAGTAPGIGFDRRLSLALPRGRVTRAAWIVAVLALGAGTAAMVRSRTAPPSGTAATIGVAPTVPPRPTTSALSTERAAPSESAAPDPTARVTPTPPAASISTPSVARPVIANARPKNAAAEGTKATSASRAPRPREVATEPDSPYTRD